MEQFILIKTIQENTEDKSEDDDKIIQNLIFLKEILHTDINENKEKKLNYYQRLIWDYKKIIIKQQLLVTINKFTST